MDEQTSEGVIGTSGEPTFTQAQVNEIVGREKAKARRDAESSYSQPMDNQAMSPMGNAAISPEIMREMINKEVEENTRKREEDAAEKQREYEIAQNQRRLEEVAKSYHDKIASGKEKIPDFDTVMEDFETESFWRSAVLAEEMPNTAEVMYALAGDIPKLMRLEELAQKSGPMARKEMKKLSESIAKNTQAKEDYIPTQPPLSRLKSSNVGADSGDTSIKALKQAPWLRG